MRLNKSIVYQQASKQIKKSRLAPIKTGLKQADLKNWINLRLEI